MAPRSTLFPYTTLFRSIVAELDKYIVGQTAAKRAVAVALRNRVRRQKLPPEIAEDVRPRPRRAWRPSDRKSTRLNSSHTVNSYAVFCLKKKMCSRKVRY